MADTLSPEVALRIGLAARALPDTDPKRLMMVLVDALGLPITPTKLGRLKVTRLKAAADGELGEIDTAYLKQAVSLLRGIGVPTDEAPEPLPEVQDYAEGDMPGSIRVACASNHDTQIDGHFGSCARFLVYQVSESEVRLIAIRKAGHAPDEMDKNIYRANLIEDCQLLYTVSIGGPAAAKVVRAGLHPIKLPDGGEATELLDQLKGVIGNNPPPWLAKVMGFGAEERIRFIQDEEEYA
ncbi:dinitrogenase iron-molybdenum cofactor biosynthesis protein [Marinobacterium sp. D7]|uniref:dinitrogenase iron-molybdenum cofactor biosynthesis protein n=1 Tax=Marinobacterium ramblicola TaxID=2849041 RepID=UPI001C2D90C1|nr:dinitrogenase iron-molybdenum cofactor biosynthesis protein [Marinobacterium ramblicola]MBV1789732.1 dinitrogenase iron-molybdenum cofactor biosynthesis protein [Marinobacterium ramblicola]